MHKPASSAWGLPLIIISVALPLCSCVEEQDPEIFLPPRNFNPHPYQNGYEPRRNGNTGPVLFPENAPGPGVNGNSGRVRVEGARHPVDDHPYATVAKRQRYKLAGRFDLKSNEINPGVYDALDAYAKRVLRKPPAAYRDPVDTSASNLKKHYAFSYKVLDRATGDDFSHSQSQTPQATKGEYRVKLPDGRIQIVSYTADENGYKADVKYADDENAAVGDHPPVGKPATLLHPQEAYDYQQYPGFDAPNPRPGYENERKINVEPYYAVTAAPGFYVDDYAVTQTYDRQKVQVYNPGESGATVEATLVPYAAEPTRFPIAVVTATPVPEYGNVYRVKLYNGGPRRNVQQVQYKK